MFYIYLITNLVNGKMYVGQTELAVEKRFREHIYCKMKQDYFHAAIRKYGKDAFVVEEISQCAGQEEANEAEIFWIDRYNTANRTLGYNTTHGGRYGSSPNEATKAKIGAYSRTRVHDEDTREKMRQSHLDKDVPENQTGFRGVSLPLRQCRTFRARSKVNGHEVAFGFHRDPLKTQKMREEGVSILRKLTVEEIADLLQTNTPNPIGCVSATRWKSWVADWMDAQTTQQEAA
jgi:group I intron endonuclease